MPIVIRYLEETAGKLTQIDSAFRHETKEGLGDYSDQFQRLAGANPGGG